MKISKTTCSFTKKTKKVTIVYYNGEGDFVISIVFIAQLINSYWEVSVNSVETCSQEIMLFI